MEETVTTSEPGRSVSKDASCRGSVARVEVVLVNTYDGTGNNVSNSMRLIVYLELV